MCSLALFSLSVASVGPCARPFPHACDHEGKWADVGGYVMANRYAIRLNPSFAMQATLTGWNPLGIYEDLYLTEQPYGLVCGVETDLPANDSSSAAFT